MAHRAIRRGRNLDKVRSHGFSRRLAAKRLKSPLRTKFLSRSVFCDEAVSSLWLGDCFALLAMTA